MQNIAYRVNTSAEAERDLDEILEWLLLNNAGETGLHWVDGLQAAISSLENIPRRCGLAAENDQYPLEVRQLLYGTRPHVYRILFTIQNDIVTILHIRHGRRLPQSPH